MVRGGLCVPRAISNILTNSINKTLATKVLKKDRDLEIRCLESIQAHLLALLSYRRFLNDEEFRGDVQNRNLHTFRSRCYWLRRMKKRRLPTRNDTRSLDPSIGNGRVAASTCEDSVCSCGY